MEINYSDIQSYVIMNKENKVEELEDAYEDDEFYEELRRQIMILTADDEEEEGFLGRTKCPSSNNIIDPCMQGSKRLGGRFASTLQPGGSYFSWRESENAHSKAVPTWLVNLWRNGSATGTGVFIPQIVNPRRRYRPGRKKNEESRMYRQAPKRKDNHYTRSS